MKQTFTTCGKTKTNLLKCGKAVMLICILLLSTFSVFATTFNQQNATIYATTGTVFQDPGGTGNYADNVSYTFVIKPAASAMKVQVAFSAFSTENNYDGLMIYNGPTTASPLISSGLGAGTNATTCPAGAWRGTGSPGTVTSTASDGSLTFVFKSDGSTNSTGWLANITLTGSPCGGTFSDVAGPSTNYGNLYSDAQTLIPPAGQKIQLVFSAFATEANFDGLMIYNGNSTAAALISSGAAAGTNATTCPAGAWSGTTSPGTITSTASDGSLTLVFKADGSTTAAGFNCTVTCFTPCTSPTAYTVTGGGSYCPGGAGVAVGLSNSQTGVNYQLKLNGSNIGSVVAGTNAAISFGNQTSVGTYTVDAIGVSGYCTTATAMSGSVSVAFLATPPALGSISGTTSIACGATSALTVALPTGGTISSSGGYRFHTFTSNGTFNTPVANSYEVLVVSGGGGGGSNGGGGGAGGGVTYNSALSVAAGNTTVTIGSGGAASATSSVTGSKGGASAFGAVSPQGGGGGASRDGGGGGMTGGSGGGGGGGTGNTGAGAGTAGQGNNGGTGYDNGCNSTGAGGGGAGGVGGSASSNVGGAGGAGVQYAQFASVAGSPAGYFAGGGGGGTTNYIGCGGSTTNGTNGAGGTGGGGAGESANGTANTGGGGGAERSGGSGIVIVRYPDLSAGTWSSSNGTVATVNSSGVVTGVGAGTATISYTVTLGSCTSVASTTVTVGTCNPPSISTFSPTSACVGTGATITITGANLLATSAVTINGVAASFTVTNATTLSATLPAGVTAGTGNITVTTPNGTYSSASIPLSFTANPLATAGSIQYNGTTQTICSGSTISVSNLTSPTNGGSGTLTTVWYCGEFVSGTGYTNWKESTLSNVSGTTSSANLNAAAGGGSGTAFALTNYNPQTDFPGKTDFQIIRRAYTSNCGLCPVSCQDQSFYLTVRPTPTATISGTTTVCQGAGAPNITFTNPMALPITVSYNINGGGTLTANVGASTTAAVAAPTGSAGTFNYNLSSVVYQTAPTCSNTISGTATVTVTANVTPSVSIAVTAGSTTMCAGSSITFTATPTNGGGSPTYSFRVGGTPVQTGSSATYTTTTLTNGQSVDCILTPGGICVSPATATSNAIAVTVNPLLTPAVSIAITSGTNPMCTGASTTFTATPTNGGGSPSYNFRVGGSSVQSGSSNTYTTTGLTNGQVVDVIMTSNATCPSPSTATSSGITMTVNAYTSVPAISGTSSVCPGTTTQLTNTAGYFVQSFTTVGASSFTPPKTGTIEVLVVAGGGGGGNNGGGGGGGGGVVYNAAYPTTAGTPIALSVGGGGAGATTNTVTASNGTNSTFGTITALKGGGGASRDGGGAALATSASVTGSGGGGAGSGNNGSAVAGFGTSGQGNNGGAGTPGDQGVNSAGGGGGGAGGVGTAAGIPAGGNGGVGVSNSITGAAVFYGGGGGGGKTVNGTKGSGGNGGGGAGGVAGTANTGGGGGGGSGGTGADGGAAGGSGIVIVKYPNFTWSSSNTSIATVSSNGLVTGVSTGTVTISYAVTNPSGCTTTVSTVVTVGTAPSISVQPVAQNACANTASVSFSVTASGATSYQWQWNNGGTWANFTDGLLGVSGATTNQITFSTPLSSLGAATWSIRAVVNGSTCSVNSNAVNFVVYPALTANAVAVAQTVCNNNTGAVNLTRAGGSGSYTYTWSNGPTTQNISSVGSGTYTVTVNDAGCPGVSATSSATVTAPWGATAGGYQNLCTAPTYLTGDIVGTLPLVTNTTTIFSENFESYGSNALLNPTVGNWTEYYVSGSGYTYWMMTGSCPINGSRSLTLYNGYGANCNYDNGYSYNSVVYNSGSKINATGYTNLKLNFKWRGTAETPSYDYAQAVWSTNGTTWNNVSGAIYNGQAGTQTVTNLDLSAANGQQFFIGFRWVNDASAGSDPFNVDDITVTGDQLVTATPTYSWTGPGTITGASSASASSTAAGTFTLNVTANGCTSPATAVLTTPVITEPTVAASPTPICFSGTVNLAASGMAPAGNVAVFNGSTSIGSSLLSYANNFTMEFWVNPGATRTATTQANSGVSAGSGLNLAWVPCSTVGATDAGAGIAVGTNGVSVVENSNGSYLPTTLVAPATLTGWTHVAVVYINKVPNLYINGTFVKQGLATGKTNVYPSLGTGMATYGMFTGSIDNIRVWSTSRTQAQIQAEMYRDVPLSTSGLVALYTFDASNLAGQGGFGSTLSGNPTYAAANYYSYSWTASTGTTPTSSPATNTNTSVSVTNNTAADITYVFKGQATAGGCSGTLSSGSNVLVKKDPAAPTSGGDQSVCASALPATLSATPPSGYNVSWYNSGGTLLQANSNTYITSTAGTYYAVSTLSGSCSGSVSTPVTLTINANPVTPTASVTAQPTCSVPSGTITVTAPTGANINYSINGSTYQASGTFSGVNPGTYTVTAKNTTTGCISTTGASVTVNAVPAIPAAPTASVTAQPVCGTPTGTITVTAPTGANINYSVDGTNYQASGTFSGLAAGSYNVTSKNTTSGCVSSATALTVNTAPATPVAPTASVTAQPSCGTATGTITVTAPTGANITYSIDGTTYQASGTFSGVGAGSYTVTAKNTTSGCVSSGTSVTVNPAPSVPVAPTASATAQPTCALGTGTITVTAPTGANINYSVDGTNYQASGTFSGLSPATYSVTTKNTTSGCVSTGTGVTINAAPAVPATPTASATTQPSCSVASGTIVVTAPTGANITYSIDGSTYQASGTFNTVNAGTYTVTAKNTTTGCVSSGTSVTINAQPAIPVAPTASVTSQPTCLVSTGTITVTAPTGANINYSINGSTYQASGTFSGVAAGGYSVTAKNTTSGCVSSGTAVTVNAQPAVPATPTVSVTAQPTCSVATGTITITAPTGANITYSIDGTNYQASGTFSGVNPGAYNATAKNTTSGCVSANASVTVNPQPAIPAAPTASVTTQPTCAVPTGTITVTAPTGANINYSIDGSTYQSGTAFSSVAPGNYSVTTKNTTSGCISATGTSVTVNAVPAVPSTPVVTVSAQPTCATSTGSVTVTSPVGASYEYAVDGGTYQSSATISGIAPGSHTVTARLAASPTCISAASGSFTINSTPSPLTTTPVNVCQGGQGYLTATNVCVDNFVVPTITNSIYGGWLSTDALANAPSGAVNTTTCSFGGASRTYSIVQFQVSATGNYIFEMNDNTTYNGAGYITTGAFTPGSCATGNLLRVDNDGGSGDEPVLGSVGNPLTLSAGVTYSLVSTTDGASNVINNDYTWTITPPAGENILLNQPGTVEWYTAASGGSPIGTGTDFDPVGVPGSGISNTNTAGTTYFYAACSSSPSCRTQAAYTVTTTAPTFTVTPVNGSTCYDAGNPVSIGLSGSTSGFPYQIFKDGSSVGMPAATTGTGGAISLGSVTADGIYTVAVHSGSCDIPMTGSVEIKPVPVADAGADVALPCSGGIGLTGSSNTTTLFTENFGATTNTQLSPTSSGWRLKYLYGTHPGNRTEWWIGYNGGSPYSFSCSATGAALGTVDNRQYQSDVPCDYAWDAGTMDEIAYNTTAIDARLYTSVNVAFNYMAGGNYSGGTVKDYMQVMYSLDNGVTWVAVSAGNNAGSYTLNRQLNGATNAFFSLTPGTSQFGTANVSMPAAVIGKKFLLGFRWVNDGNLTGDFVGNMLVDNINVTGAASYSWSPLAGVSNGTTATPTITQAGTYTLVVTAGNGCSASDQVVVSPAPGSTLGTITAADQTGYGNVLCADGTRDPNNITFNTPASSGSTYLWYYKEVTGATPPAAPVAGSGTSGWTSTGITTSSYNPPAFPIGIAGKSRTYACFVTPAACASADWASGARKITVDAVFTQSSTPDKCFNLDNVGSNFYVRVNATGGTPGYTWPVSGAVTYGAGNGALSANTHLYEFPLSWSGTIPVTDNLGCVAAGGNSETVYMPTTQPDDIASSTFVGPGTETAVDECYDLGFNRWVTYYDVNEHIIMAINAKDNNLGKVSVGMYRNPDEPVILNSSWNTDACYQSPVRPMERHFVVTTANGPSSWGGTQKVGVRLFFTDQELQDLITETYGVNGSSNWNTTCATDDDVTSINDLYVTKYTAPQGNVSTEDGDYSNNIPQQAGGLYRIFGDGTTAALGNGPLKRNELGQFNALYGGSNAHHYVEMDVEEFSEFWLHGSANHIQPLPVTMLFLEANAVNNAYIQLRWATSVEINNDGFRVERSADGQTWAEIGFVNGHDNTTSQTNYTFDDLNVTVGVVYYYRLKQVDNDGAFEYTDIVSAKLTGAVTFSVKDFIPNPTMDKTTLIITGTKDQDITVTFYNVVGQKVLESNHQVNKGGNMIEFDLGKMASGTYTAVVSSANEVYTKKVVLAK